MTFAEEKALYDAKKPKEEPRCRVCGDTAAWETLSNYGAMCGACYASYCRSGEPPRHMTVADKRAALEKLRNLGNIDPHAWAHRLREKRANGERLSPAQRHCLSVYESRHSALLG